MAHRLYYLAVAPRCRRGVLCGDPAAYGAVEPAFGLARAARHRGHSAGAVAARAAQPLQALANIACHKARPPAIQESQISPEIGNTRALRPRWVLKIFVRRNKTSHSRKTAARVTVR